ncbi:DsrE family protein [Guyparkeria sp.]|uniref:DsrE family protein n=1 Tax=Guyparkeria sp. TaxID=2035736 RepID=UPI003971167B
MIATIRRLAVTAILTLGLFNPAMADDHKRTFFYNITTDDTWAAGMAAGQANKALEAGQDVVLFLNVRGVYLASISRQQDTFAAAGMTPQQLLQAAMNKGGRVVICPMCMKQAGMSMDDVIEGVEQGGPEVTFKALNDPDTVVLSY